MEVLALLRDHSAEVRKDDRIYRTLFWVPSPGPCHPSSQGLALSRLEIFSQR
ncbi:hypothetical protein A2U01_0116229, partial [Trifolium medium]|nr:hypothetical protein [Trifolium medium]